MSKRYNKLVAAIEALTQEVSDISEVVPAVDAGELVKQLRLIVLNSKTK